VKLILGGINGEYLSDILEQAVLTIDEVRRTDEVWAAVAYASGFHDGRMLIRWCFDQNISLKFWGRLDDCVAVDVEILNQFLNRRSPDYVCKLVAKHHAKVIWWRGYGVYIGSANLTSAAWHKNVEAGCFFEEAELDDAQDAALVKMFETLEANSSPLTEELRDLMATRGKKLKQEEIETSSFWSHPAVRRWVGWSPRHGVRLARGGVKPSSSSGTARYSICATSRISSANERTSPVGSSRALLRARRQISFYTRTTIIARSMAAARTTLDTTNKIKGGRRRH